MLEALCYITISIILSGCALERIYSVVNLIEDLMED